MYIGHIAHSICVNMGRNDNSSPGREVIDQKVSRGWDTIPVVCK